MSALSLFMLYAPRRRVYLAVAIGLIVAGIADAPALAAKVTWGGGNGNWAVGNGGWSNGNWANGNDAVFGKLTDSAGTISVSSVTPNSVTFDPSASGNYILNNGTITFSNGASSVTANSNANINSALFGDNGTTVTFAGLGNLAVSGSISEKNSSTKWLALQFNGPGMVSLSNSNSFSHGVTINGGIMVAGNAGAFGTGGITNNATFAVDSGVTFTKAVTCNSGATLAGLGVYSTGGTLTVPNNVTVAPGIADGVRNIGTLTIGNRLTFSGSSSFAVDVANGVSDQLTVNGNAVLAGATLTINANAPSGGRYVLLNTSGGSITGTFTGSAPAGYRLNYANAEVAMIHKATIGAISATPANASIITGGSTPFTFTVANSAPTGGDNLGFSATAGSNAGGSVSSPIAVAPQTTCGAQSGLVFQGAAVGSNRTGSFTVSDANASNSSQSGTVSVDVYDHAGGSVSSNTLSMPGVIIGYSAGQTSSNSINVSNAAGFRVNLKTTNNGPAASITVGNVAAVGSGSSQPLAATLAVGKGIGAYSQAFTLSYADDSPLNGASASLGATTITVTGTVYDHSNASFAAAGNQTSTTIDFGNVLKGAVVPSQSFTICNRAANTTVGNTAGMKLTGFTASGDAALSADLSPFGGLSAGNGVVRTASINTNQYTTTGLNTITIAAAQLADDSSLSGAGNNNNGGLTLTLRANVGKATANAGNSPNTYGAGWHALVNQDAPYTNLESTVTATSGSGGLEMVGSTATILAGSNSSGAAQTVSMSWRTQTQSERINPGLVSDIMHLEGMAWDGSGRTDPFVLQLNYNPAWLPDGAQSETLAAAVGSIYLGWRDPSTNTWKNAIDGNFGQNAGGFHVGAWPTGDMVLGDWGVNTANHTVWAVINHNSDFAVVPEPTTGLLLALAAIALIVIRVAAAPSPSQPTPENECLDAHLPRHGLQLVAALEPPVHASRRTILG